MAFFRRKARSGDGSEGARTRVRVDELPDLSSEPYEQREDQLHIRYGHRHLYVTHDGTWASFVLGEVDWQYQPADRRRTIRSAQNHRWSELEGYRIRLRGTSVPVDPAGWAERIDRDHPHPDVPRIERTQRRVTPRARDVEGARSFDDVLRAGQIAQHLLDARTPVTVLDVRITDQQVVERELPRLLSGKQAPDSAGPVEEYRLQLRKIAATVAGEGFKGHPITARALGWLVHASQGMGMPVPATLVGRPKDGWAEVEVPGFTNSVVSYANPFATSTTIRAIRGSEEHQRHVVVLHCDRFGDRDPDNPNLMPFFAWLQTLPYPVEYVGTFDLTPGRELRGVAEYDRRKAKNIATHHAEHDDDPPAAIQRAIERAREYEDEVTNGDQAVSGRAIGVVSVAVVGATEAEAAERAREVTSLAAEQQRITLFHEYAQRSSYMSFTPGEPALMTGHVTQMPLYYLASGVPNASTGGGDDTGFFVGPIAGGHDVCRFDTFGGSRRDKSNLIAVLANLGSGKSSLVGALIDWNVTLGVRTVAYDPAGEWRRIAELPWHRQHSRVLDLASARPGTLVPSTLVFEPRPDDYATTDEYRAARAEAEAERMGLMIDTFRDLLPAAMVSGDSTGRVVGNIQSAVTHVGGFYGVDPWQVVDVLSRSDDVGRYIAEQLTSRARLKDGALIFPERNREVDDEQGMLELDQALLTVVSMKGLALPPKHNPDRSTWTIQQQQAAPVINLGTRFASRVMYADKERKFIPLDEIGVAASGGHGSFGPFMTRASTDSRKWNAAVALLGQNPDMLTSIADNVTNLVGSAWVGRMTEDAAREVQPVLGLRTDSGHDQTVVSLEQGEFLVRDWAGRVRRVRVWRDHWDELLRAALDTNPYGENSLELVDGGIFGRETA